MILDYSSIFALFVDMCKTAMPIAIFLYLLNIVITLFFRTGHTFYCYNFVTRKVKEDF